MFQCLHSSHLSSSWKLFQSLLDSALNDKVKNYKNCKNYFKIIFQKNYITPHLLLKCCRGDLYFSPSLSPLSLVTSLPPSLSLCLLPSLGSCDLESLRQLMGEGLEGYPLMDVLLPWLPDEFQQEGGLDEGVWSMGVVTSLMITVLTDSLDENLVSYENKHFVRTSLFLPLPFSSSSFFLQSSLVLPVVSSSLKWLVESRQCSAISTVQCLLNR